MIMIVFKMKPLCSSSSEGHKTVTVQQVKHNSKLLARLFTAKGVPEKWIAVDEGDRTAKSWARKSKPSSFVKQRAKEKE